MDKYVCHNLGQQKQVSSVRVKEYKSYSSIPFLTFLEFDSSLKYQNFINFIRINAKLFIQMQVL